MTTTWIRGDGFNPKIGPTTTSETYLAIPGSPPARPADALPRTAVGCGRRSGAVRRSRRCESRLLRSDEAPHRECRNRGGGTVIREVPASDADAGGIGLLSFTTELVATAPQLEQAKQHVIRQGISEPVFAQVPWIGGKAVFATALAEGDGFVEKLLGEVKPDLAGGNRALFSVKLTEEGARLVEALVTEEGPSPLGVRYELEYAGCGPRWPWIVPTTSGSTTSFRSGFELGVAYEGIGARASVESATQKLIQSGAISIEVLNFTDSADLQSRVDEAVRWFQEKLLEDFFKTSLQPPATRTCCRRRSTPRARSARHRGRMRRKSIHGRPARGETRHYAGCAEGARRPGGEGGSAAGRGHTFGLKLQFTLRDIHQEELKDDHARLDALRTEKDRRRRAFCHAWARGPKSWRRRITGVPGHAQVTGATTG